MPSLGGEGAVTSCVAEVVTQRPCASEWQDAWEYAVTICFTNPTNSLQTCLCIVSLARWQSGHAEDCKSLYVGSIPARASNYNHAIIRASPGLPAHNSEAAQL